MSAARRRVRVDARMCEAHALCLDLAPEVFNLAEDVATCDAEPEPDRHANVDAAIAACPRQAISWIDAPLSAVAKGPTP